VHLHSGPCAISRVDNAASDRFAALLELRGCTHDVSPACGFPDSDCVSFRRASSPAVGDFDCGAATNGDANPDFDVDPDRAIRNPLASHAVVG
jgi:hypothetical protein